MYSMWNVSIYNKAEKYPTQGPNIGNLDMRLMTMWITYWRGFTSITKYRTILISKTIWSTALYMIQCLKYTLEIINPISEKRQNTTLYDCGMKIHFTSIQWREEKQVYAHTAYQLWLTVAALCWPPSHPTQVFSAPVLFSHLSPATSYHHYIQTNTFSHHIIFHLISLQINWM